MSEIINAADFPNDAAEMQAARQSLLSVYRDAVISSRNPDADNVASGTVQGGSLAAGVGSGTVLGMSGGNVITNWDFVLDLDTMDTQGPLLGVIS